LAAPWRGTEECRVSDGIIRRCASKFVKVFRARALDIGLGPFLVQQLL
jgi:hypothetical protein